LDEDQVSLLKDSSHKVGELVELDPEEKVYRTWKSDFILAANTKIAAFLIGTRDAIFSSDDIQSSQLLRHQNLRKEEHCSAIVH